MDNSHQFAEAMTRDNFTHWFVPKGDNLTGDQKDKIDLARREFIDFARKMDELLPAGRRKSIVFTELEHMSHMAIKSITHT